MKKESVIFSNWPGILFEGSWSDIIFYRTALRGLKLEGDPAKPTTINVSGAVAYDRQQHQQEVYHR